MDGSGSKTIVAVQIDRCWNRHWRCLLFVSVVAMSSLSAAMWVSMSRARNMDGLLETDWQKHWSKQSNSQKASKTVIEQSNDGNRGGINVQTQDESLKDYLNDKHDSEANDVDYYDNDHPDLPKNRPPSQDYLAQYIDEVRKAKANRSSTLGILNILTPKVKDYTLQPNFRNPFTDLTDEEIEFDDSYKNPCWAESIPRFPYLNNSYLRVSSQARELEPQFQLMRKRFAGRQEPATRWRLRCLPSFYIMETPPLASPSLFSVLSYHPKVATPVMQEPEFWNQKGPSGVATLQDYVDLYDAVAQEIRDDVDVERVDGRATYKHNMITGDGTSSYLWTLDSWEKIKGNQGETEPKVTAADIIGQLTPLAKFVFVLRNPTERLFQGYLSRSESPSASDFYQKAGDALEKMTKCEKTRSLRSCIYDSFLNKNLPVRLRIGMYYPFIADWLRVFRQEQIMVIRYEDYVAKPSEVINEVCKFLGLSPFPFEDLAATEEAIKTREKQRLADQKVTMLSTTRAMIKSFHKQLNDELAALLGDEKFTWPELAVDAGQSSDGSQKLDDEEEEEEKRNRKAEEAEEIKKQRELQIAEQQRRMNEYMEKRRQWALQQQELRQKLLAQQQDLLRRKAQEQQPQQPSQQQHQQQQQQQQAQQQQQQQQQQIQQLQEQQKQQQAQQQQQQQAQQQQQQQQQQMQQLQEQQKQQQAQQQQQQQAQQQQQQQQQMQQLQEQQKQQQAQQQQQQQKQREQLRQQLQGGQQSEQLESRFNRKSRSQIRRQEGQ